MWNTVTTFSESGKATVYQKSSPSEKFLNFSQLHISVKHGGSVSVTARQ